MKLLNIFGLLVLAGTSLASCDDDYPKYQACAAKAGQFTKFKSAEEVESYCKSFEVDECKDFLEVVSTTSECIKDTSKLPVVAGYQLPYLAYCGKTGDNDCPLTTFIKEHYSEFESLSVENIPQEALQAVTNDCKDAACNKRIITIGESMQEPMIAAGAPQIFGETYKFFTLLYENYKNNNCDLTGGSSNSNNSTTDNKDDKKENDSSAANNLNIISYSCIGMILMAMAMML